MSRFSIGSILHPYSQHLKLKADRLLPFKEMHIAAPVQSHSILGTKEIPGFTTVYKQTAERIEKKFHGGLVGDTVPTAATSVLSSAIKSDKLLISKVALNCVVPSESRSIAKRLDVTTDDAQSILTALAHRKVVDEIGQSGKYLLSILQRQPLTGSSDFTNILPDLAFLGWMDAKGIDDSSIDQSSQEYFSIVNDVKPASGKETKDVIVFDLLRAPGASPTLSPLQKGQLAYLFENVYSSPIHEAALFATLAMPQTMDEVRDRECSKPVSDILDEVWSKCRIFKFIDQDYRTTPYGERVVDTLSGTPLSSYQHVERLERYYSKNDISWSNPIDYRDEFINVVYSGLLHKILSQNCGYDTSVKMMVDWNKIEFYLRSLKTQEFYQPEKLAENLGIDDTAAKNVYATAFRYGACGVTTTSHPHLFKPVRKATLKSRSS